jgi:probable HAF family extracellular repeat protein
MTGQADRPGGMLHAFLYSGGTMADLGTLAGPGAVAMSAGFGINNLGQVTGASETEGVFSPTSQTHAFLYGGGSLTDLGALPGQTYSVGVAINDAGHIRSARRA